MTVVTESLTKGTSFWFTVCDGVRQGGEAQGPEWLRTVGEVPETAADPLCAVGMRGTRPLLHCVHTSTESDF